MKNLTRFRVRFSETDPLGIVWHGHYITYFEDGRESFGHAFGISYQHIREAGYLAPVVKCTCEYKLPLRYGEEATVETVFANNPAAKMVFAYRILNSQGQLAATGETVQVFTDFESNLILANPPFFEAWKEKHGLL